MGGSVDRLQRRGLGGENPAGAQYLLAAGALQDLERLVAQAAQGNLVATLAQSCDQGAQPLGGDRVDPFESVGGDRGHGGPRGAG